MSKSSLSVGTKIWADKINTVWRRGIAVSAEIAINIGHALLEAKEAIPHGDFENMVKTELDFSPQTARKMMAVARDQRLANRAPGCDLPDHWTIRYELTKLSDDELDQGVKDGTINPEMRRSDVPKKRKEFPVGDAVSATAGSENTLLAAAAPATPLDDAEGGDSVVTVQDPEETAAAEAAAWEAFRHFPVVKRTTDQDGSVTLHVRPDPISRLVNGMALILGATRELYPPDAAEEYPEDMRLSPDDIAYVVSWLLAFEDADKTRIGVVNEAAQ